MYTYTHCYCYCSFPATWPSRAARPGKCFVPVTPVTVVQTLRHCRPRASVRRRPAERDASSSLRLPRENLPPPELAAESETGGSVSQPSISNYFIGLPVASSLSVRLICPTNQIRPIICAQGLFEINSPSRNTPGTHCAQYTCQIDSC